MKKIILISSLFILQSTFSQEVVTMKNESTFQFINRVSFGVLGGQDETTSIHVINGFSMNKHFDFSIGLGMESYYNSKYIPIFGELKYTILSSKTSPFVSLMSGYLSPLQYRMGNTKFSGGFTTGIQIGVTRFFAENIGISTGIGYRFASVQRQDYYHWWGIESQLYTTQYNMNRFELRFALIFK
jgi:hypothetical protein